MGKNAASYKFEKRKKEIARQKKQEEKRQRLLQKKHEKEGSSTLIPSDGQPIIPSEDIGIEPDQPDSPEPVV